MIAQALQRSNRPIRESGQPAASTGSRFVARELLRATRPHQWVKNILVLVAPVVAGTAFRPGVFTTALVAATAFCAASAATYLVNDLADIDADRLHPTKQLRPIAAGTLPVETARSVAVISASAAFGLAAGIGSLFLGCLFGYLVLTSVYSHWLKRIPVLDIAAVAAGFVLRVVAGGVAIGVASSGWLLVGVGFGAVLISLGKRHGEVGRLGSGAADHRAVLRWYRPALTRELMLVSESACFASVAIWLWFTLPVGAATAAALAVAVPLERFRRLVLSGGVDDPVQLIATDRTIAGAGLLFTGLLGVGLYL